MKNRRQERTGRNITKGRRRTIGREKLSKKEEDGQEKRVITRNKEVGDQRDD